MTQQMTLPLSFDRPAGPADWADHMARAETSEQAAAILRTIETDLARMEREAGLGDILERHGIRRSLPEVLPGEWYRHIGQAPQRHRVRLAEAYNLAQAAFREHGLHPYGRINEEAARYGAQIQLPRQEDEPEYGIAV